MSVELGRWGIFPEGFLRPSIREILEVVERDQSAEISSTLDHESAQVLTQINGIWSRQLGIAWENLEILAGAMDPDNAEDFLLEFIAKLTGTPRRKAVPTRVACQCDLAIGTVLEHGVHFAHLEGKPDVRFTIEKPADPEVPFEATVEGLQTVVFVSENDGPVACPAGELTVIATQVEGWRSINNPLDGELGRLIDEDPELRQRREEELTRGGSTTPDAIEADLLHEVEGIESVHVLHNDLNRTNANGLPPHSVEAVIWDGLSPAADDEAIAQVIWGSQTGGGKAGGIQAFGTTFAFAVDSRGFQQVVAFTRATPALVYLHFRVKPGEDYVGDEALKAKIAARCNADHKASTQVVQAKIDALIFDSALALGVDDRQATQLGLTAFPSGTANIPIGVREIARFDTSRITVELL